MLIALRIRLCVLVVRRGTGTRQVGHNVLMKIAKCMLLAAHYANQTHASARNVSLDFG